MPSSRQFSSLQSLVSDVLGFIVFALHCHAVVGQVSSSSIMKERITVSVSTVHGSHHFHLGTKTQRSIRGALWTVFFVALSTGVCVYYLLSQVDFAKHRQQELETESLTLSEELKTLQQLKLDLESDLDERENRLSNVSDRLRDIEGILNVDSEEPQELESRLDVATLTSAVRRTMLQELPSGAPVTGARISSGFGRRVHPVTGRSTMHRGLDFAVNTGTKVYAPADGVVEVVRPSREGSGNFLKIQHAFGFSSSYSHLHRFDVKQGEFVKKGQLIARSGNTGLSSGPHLHYEVRFVGRALDPRPFVDWDLDNFETIFEKEKGIRWEFLVNRLEQRLHPHLQLSSQKAATSPESSS